MLDGSETFPATGRQPLTEILPCHVKTLRIAMRHYRMILWKFERLIHRVMRGFLVRRALSGFPKRTLVRSNAACRKFLEPVGSKIFLDRFQIISSVVNINWTHWAITVFQERAAQEKLLRASISTALLKNKELNEDNQICCESFFFTHCVATWHTRNNTKDYAPEYEKSKKT